MANNIQISVAARNAALDAVLTLIDSGGAGTIKVYNGSQPADPGTAVSGQTLGATLGFSSPAFGASSGGTATANAISPDTDADATITATWFRIASGGATAVIDGTVGVTGCDINFNTNAFPIHATISISSLTFTHP